MQQIKRYLRVSVVEKFFCNMYEATWALDIKLFNLGYIADGMRVFHVENSCVSATTERDPVRLVVSTYTYRRYPLMYTEHDVPISFDRVVPRGWWRSFHVPDGKY